MWLCAGLSKFDSDVYAFVLKFVQVKYIGVHVRVRFRVFEIVKLLLASLQLTLD